MSARCHMFGNPFVADNMVKRQADAYNVCCIGRDICQKRADSDCACAASTYMKRMLQFGYPTSHKTDLHMSVNEGCNNQACIPTYRKHMHLRFSATPGI